MPTVVSRLASGDGIYLCGSAVLGEWEADWVQIPAVTLTCWVTLGKCLNSSGSRFSPL